MFITFEGGEGSGKTTQLKLIAQFLQKCNKEYLLTREPGGTDIGKAIRSILLDSNTKGLNPKAELLLYAADRVQHIEKVIKPALNSGITVLCDRFSDSTTVYQGFARGVDIDLVQNINNIVLDNLKPDITFLLDLPAEVGLARAFDRINNVAKEDKKILCDESRFEHETLDFHNKIRDGFLKIGRLELDRFIIIDAIKDKLKIRDEIITHMRKNNVVFNA